MNYDASKVGVPYVRANRIIINYPPAPEMPNVVIEQSLAVKLADESVRELEVLAPINVTLDMLNDANLPIPIVSPEDGSKLGMDTSLLQVMLGILAVVRSKQVQAP